MNRSCFTANLAIALVALTVRCATAQTRPTTAPADPRTLIREAIAAGANRVVIPPGIYRMRPENGSKVIVPIENAHDLDIVADGVTIIGTQRTRALALIDCRNVKLHGLKLDYDPLPFTQGSVIGAADDDSWIDVKLDAGYPREPFKRIDIIDRTTRYRKNGMPYLWNTTAEMVQPDVVRVHKKDIAKAAEVGDLASLSTGNDPDGICHGMTLENCHGGMVLEDLTILSAPGMGIVETKDSDGGTVIRRVRIMPGPPPPGATAQRLLSTSWDGILHNSVKVGPLVEDCIFITCGDDSWSVQSQSFLVLKADGRRITVSDGMPLLAGDHLKHSLDSPSASIQESAKIPIGEAGLSSEVLDRLEKTKKYTLWDVPHELVQVFTLAADSPFAVGTALYCPDRMGNGFVFRNNYTHNPGRILIKAGGLMEHNVLDHPHAVCVDPEASAAGIQNLTIRGNTIIGSGFFYTSAWIGPAAGITFNAAGDRPVLRPDSVFEHITIDGNILRGINGLNLQLASARDVNITNNLFADTHASPVPPTGASYRIPQDVVMFFSQCNAVRVAGNHVVNTGLFARGMLETGPGVSELTTDTPAVPSTQP